ncbi:MAG: hypothetical protein ABFS08_01470 [Pseudomonadota bacterium]
MKFNLLLQYQRAASRILLSLLLVLLSPVTAFAAPDSLLKQAEQFIQSQRNTEAYELLQNEAEEYAGEADYDYLLGLAALRADLPEQAMFALERCVMVQPGHAAARMELVSAYTQLGLNQQAEMQLSILDKQEPPALARKAMAQYRDVLRPRLSGTPDPVRLLALGAGYDSNTGSFPDMGIDLGGILLTVAPVESPYSLFKGTLWQPYQLNDKQRVDVTLHAQQRFYQEEDAKQFDLGLLHAGALLNTTLDPLNKLGAGIKVNRLWLDGEAFRNHISLSGSWERRLGAGLRGELSLQAGQNRFEQESFDYDVYGVAYRVFHKLSPALRTTFNLEFEQEGEVNARLGGDASRWALSGQLDYRIDNRNVLGMELKWSEVGYATDYLPGTLYNLGTVAKERTDRGVDLNANWRHSLTQAWELNGDVTYHTQDSSLEFYSLDRWTAQLSVARYF